MGTTTKHLCLIGLAAGLFWPGVAKADGNNAQNKTPNLTPRQGPATPRVNNTQNLTPRQAAPWPAAIKHRNARYAVLDRSFDAIGDDHEAFVLQYEMKRRLDKLGAVLEPRSTADRPRPDGPLLEGRLSGHIVPAT